MGALLLLQLAVTGWVICGFVQEEQRGVSAGAAESGGPGQYEGGQPAAVLHLQRMAEQVQHVC